MRRTTAFVFVAGLFGVGLVAGGLAELTGLALASALDLAPVRALQTLHQSAWVKVTVGAVGLGSIVLGSQLALGAYRLRRDARTGLTAIRRASWGIIAMLGLAQLSLAWGLYPELGRLELPEPFPGFWLFSLVGAALPPTLLALALALAAGRQVAALQ